MNRKGWNPFLQIGQLDIMGNYLIGLLGSCRFRVLLISLFLGLNLSLSISSIFQKSITYDEYAILPQGLAVLKAGTFQLGSGVPHMAAVLPALPLLFTSAKINTPILSSITDVFQVGHIFLGMNIEHYLFYFSIGRLVSILALVVVGFLAYGFAKSLYGPSAGLIAAVLVFISPNLIAHGRLVTTDIYLTAAMIGSLWAFNFFLKFPGGKSAIVLGSVLGVVSVFKFSGILLYAVFPLVLVFLFLRRQIFRSAADCYFVLNKKTIFWSLGVISVVMVTINLCYLFDGSFSFLRDYHFKSTPFQIFRNIWSDSVPIPLPYFFIEQIDRQLADTGGFAYLLGEFNNTGFWNYYLVAFLIKLPIPTMLLCLLAYLSNWKIDEREIPMLMTALLFFLFFSLVSHKNIGLRYLLFIIPVMGIWTGRIVHFPVNTSFRAHYFTIVSGSLGILWISIISVSIWPNYLPYFNSLSGGASQGHKYLLDSNLDWGQDLLFLKEYMIKEKIHSVDLAYFGMVHPHIYGIRFKPLGAEKPQRYVAISANILWGGTRFDASSGHKAVEFQKLQPSAILGHTIYVYDTHAQRPKDE
ncbi:MAG: glycosyltransferase family 39 protein [SAR324 cluster bacterium]|nr:glycosyltransferase family 39 protein [SAR324 cluster bacterium]